MHTHPEHRKAVLFLRALANERRFDLTLLFLSGAILTCRDVAVRLKIHWTSASKHLHRMLRVGIIVSRRQGGAVEFRIAPDFQKKLKRALVHLA